MSNLMFEAVAKIDNSKCIGAASDHNSLYEIDIVTGECSFLDVIPNEKLFGRRLYVTACMLNNKVYFTPYSANEIAVYDIESREIHKISVAPANTPNYNSKNKFSGCITFNNYVYITPCTYPGIIRIDSLTNKIDYFNSWVDETFYSFRKWLTIVENKIYIPSAINNLVLCFDMVSNHGDLLAISEHNNGCWSMCYESGNFWLIPTKDACIIKWNPSAQTICEYNEFPTSFVGNDFCFTRAYPFENKLYMIPAKANMSVCLDLDTNKLLNSGINILADNNATGFLFQIDHLIFLMTSRENNTKIICIDTVKNEFNPYEFVLNDVPHNLNTRLLTESIKSKETMEENNIYKLNDYLSSVINY